MFLVWRLPMEPILFSFLFCILSMYLLNGSHTLTVLYCTVLFEKRKWLFVMVQNEKEDGKNVIFWVTCVNFFIIVIITRLLVCENFHFTYLSKTNIQKCQIYRILIESFGHGTLKKLVKFTIFALNFFCTSRCPSDMSASITDRVVSKTAYLMWRVWYFSQRYFCHLINLNNNVGLFV